MSKIPSGRKCKNGEESQKEKGKGSGTYEVHAMIPIIGI
jgi:hypothetical protein